MNEDALGREKSAACPPGTELELLAPAGSVEALDAALKAGADAVYIGGSRFGARAYADNPDDITLLRTIDRVHMAGRKLYLTVNTLFKNQELEGELLTWLAPFYRQGLDGVIVQDPGVVKVVRASFPGMEIHASTQMAVTGAAGARMMKRAGICRVVPARELSLDEIRQIHQETHLAVECFVHGAMCYSYSGMCLMSSMIGGRSGNRGRCAGVCRLPCSVRDDRGEQLHRGAVWPLSMKDLCALELLPELIEAGCTSFKIEGRMKRPEYTAGVTELYRKYIDLWKTSPDVWKVDPGDLKRLQTLFNRDGLSQGYYHTRNGRGMIALQNLKQSDQQAKLRSAAVQKAYETISAGLRKSRIKTPCDVCLELQPEAPAKLMLKAETSAGAVRAEVSGGLVQAAREHPVDKTQILRQLRKTGDSPWEIQEAELRIPDRQIFMPVSQINALRRDGLESLTRACLQKYHRQETLSEAADGIAAAGTDAAKSKTAAARTGNRKSTGKPVAPSEWKVWLQIEHPGQIDKTIQVLKKLMDGNLDKMFAGICLPLMDVTEEQMKSVCRILRADVRKSAVESAGGYAQNQKPGLRLRFSLPHVIRADQYRQIRERTESFYTLYEPDGFLARSLEGLGLLQELHMEHAGILDAGLFTWNNQALEFYRSLGFHRDTVPYELNRQELRRRDNSGSELVLYGRTPLMISAQCVRKTMDRCAKRNDTMLLRDRKGAEFPVVCCCGQCYNCLYNSVPQSLLANWADAAGITGTAVFRVIITTETMAQIEEVLQKTMQAYGAAAGGRPEAARFSFPTTGGHYKRGVE